MKRTYTALSRLSTLRERFSYLRLDGEVGCATFGSARWTNQAFYNSREWRDLRHHIIARDNGCDLGILGHDIFARGVIHHMNPVTEQHLQDRDPILLDPENLILTTHQTHNAIHYGDERLLPQPEVVRRPGDTKEW